MEIKLYNSMSNQVEIFKPIIPNKVMIYVCGPTVYNDPHLGNMRPPLVFDVLRRMFTYYGYQVKLVSNITDVDDKIIKVAIDTKTSEAEVSKKYETEYVNDLKDLNVIKYDATPHAVATIGAMIKFIEQLIDCGAAYENDGDVFFSVKSAKDYGKLGNFKVSDLQAGARVEENSKKKDPLDFALWKKTNVGITFPSPWGEGRPGWHTECVVMINDIFKQPLIDIHGGGFDLKFPHHENEIAQARALFKTELANYWLHVGFIDIDDIKMSKSLGNVINARQFIDKYGANIVRLVILSTHYRAPLNISDTVIETATTENEKIAAIIKQVEIQLQLNGVTFAPKGDETLIDKVGMALADDLNTSNALTAIYEMIKDLNVTLRKRDYNGVAKMLKSLQDSLYLLGLIYPMTKLSEADLALFKKWNDYRANKDFANADLVRQELVKKGLV
ncbi:MAG: cysteine--tRNA ligase [Bacilli bacterium]